MTDKTRPSVETRAKPNERERGRRKGVTPSPHDAMFRALLSDPVRAQALLRDHLPNEIVGLLADKPPKILDGSFVDEALRGSQSDLLIEAETVTGQAAFVYALAEHKSYPAPGVVLQLAGYMIRIWQRYAKDQAERLRNLPPIIPLVLYSGQSRLMVPEGLAELIASDNPELVFLPGERFIFRWLTEMDPADLSSDALLQAGFVTLTQRARAFLKLLVSALAGNPVLQEQFLTYILHTYPDVQIEDLRDDLSAVGADEMEELVTTIAETLEAKGRAEGEVHGVIRGRTEGEALGVIRGRKQDLTRLLERRFGPLPQAAKDRIAEAGFDQLDGWLDRVLDAKSLDAVFTKN